MTKERLTEKQSFTTKNILLGIFTETFLMYCFNNYVFK